MRTIVSILALFTLSLELPAQQTVTLTPKTLAGWSITGADHKTLTGMPELVLPAGTQLAHTFNSAEVALMVTSSPGVGFTAADWPVLEIGNTALVFARGETGGKLTLIIGDNQPVDLPFSYPLDDSGRSTELLAVGFGRQGSTVSVTFSERSMQFPAGPLSEAKLDVVASAGSGQEWAFKLLAVVVGASSVNENPRQDSPAGTDPVVDSSNTTGRPGNAGVVPTPADGASADEQAKAAIAEKPKTAADSSSLEIYTPPAHRLGRADAIRSSVAGGKMPVTGPVVPVLEAK